MRMLGDHVLFFGAKRAALPMLLAGALCACGSDDSATTAQPAADPAWTSAPASLTLVEGEDATVPLTVTPLGADVTIEAADALLAAADAGVLRVSALLSGGDDVELAVTVSANGKSKRVTVPVHVTRMKWGATVDLTKSGVAAREHPSLVHDAAHKRVLVIGGSGYKPQGMALGDSYAVSLTDGAVTPIALPGVPAGASRRVVQFAGETKAWLYGGYGDAGDLDDLLEIDLTSDPPAVTSLPQTTKPPARSLHFFVGDSKTRKFYAFGGVGGNKMLDDTWSMTITDGTATWQKLDLTDRPTKRYGFFFGTDPAQGVAYLFSGAQGLGTINPARDLWKLDLRADPPAWTKVMEGDQVPEGRRNGAFAYDAAHHRFYVWGGTPDAKASAPGLFAYDARPGVERWFTIDRPMAPVIRSSGAAFVDPETGTVRMGFGNDKGIYADLTPLGL